MSKEESADFPDFPLHSIRSACLTQLHICALLQFMPNFMTSQPQMYIGFSFWFFIGIPSIFLVVFKGNHLAYIGA